jgi:hypothetical protein
MKRNLSKDAKALCATPLIIRCHSQEERAGLAWWRREVCGVAEGVSNVYARFDDVLMIQEEVRELWSDYNHGLAIMVAGRAMVQAKKENPDRPEEFVARTVWSVVERVYRFARANKMPEATDLPESDIPWAAEGFRRVLQADLADTEEMPDETTGIRQAAIHYYMGCEDRTLVYAIVLPPLDYITDFLARGEVRDPRTLYLCSVEGDAPDEKISKKFEAFENAKRIHEAAYQASVDAGVHLSVRLAQTIKGLPVTGEMSCLLELLEPIKVTAEKIGRTRQAGEGWKPNFSIANRVLARLAVQNALSGLEWTDEARAVLRVLIQSPRVFTRHDPKSAAGREVKSRLRVLKDCFLGDHSACERESLLQHVNDKELTSQEIAWVVAEYAIGHEASPQAALGRAWACMEVVLKELWARGLPDYVGMLSRLNEYDGRARLRTDVDVEIERLEAAEKAQVPLSEETPVCPPAWKPAQLPAPSVPTKGSAVDQRKFTLSYIINPTSPTPRSIDRQAVKEEVEEALCALLQETNNQPEPVESLARALCHYLFKISPEQRQLQNKESVGTFVFHKIKRGCARIYVRLEEDRLFFHAYARRDWSSLS